MTEYDNLDWLYEVLYARYDVTVFEQHFFNQFQDVLNKSKKILDASCGNGIQAVALAREGYSITASDISEKMVELAIQRAIKQNIHLKTQVSSWQKLPEKKERYDLIFCYGNSISHSLSKEMRIQNIKSLSQCLDPEGILILDTRNWEKLYETKYTIYPEREYNGKKYIPIYIWDISNNKSLVHIVFIECDSHIIKTYEKQLTFCPFSHNEIIQEIQEAGLRVIKDSYEQNVDEYYIYIQENA